MSILDFEAYGLEYLKRGEGYYDNNGDYHIGNDEWISVGRCDAVPAGSRNIVNLPDGQMETFSFVIHIHNPKSREFKYGESIRLTTPFGCEQHTLTVKHFARYQHQCKIYA